ncbi:hypothetical protein M5689_008126 [Euphorbia peplus]|nr:hypothetical protein M5689_008126 [Euphorbia peplus]
MQFQHRWDFRRLDNDFDSSSNDSRSGLGGERGPDHKRHNPVPCSVPVDNDQTSKFQRKGSSIDPDISGQTEIGKPVKGKRGRSKNLDLNEKNSGRRKVVRRKKGENNAALDDLKNHMNTLLEELKVTRKNLLSWMREEMKKLAAEEKEASGSEQQKDGLKDKEIQIQLQHQTKENARVEYRNLFGKSIQVPYQNNFAEHVHVQNPVRFEGNLQMQNLINLEDDPEPPKSLEKVQMPRRNNINCTKNGNGRTYKRSNKSKKSADSNTPQLEHEADYSHANVLLNPEEDGEEKSEFPDKSNPQSDVSDKNVQMQPQKSIVLGIKAQNCKDGPAPKSTAKGKKPAQVPKFQDGMSGFPSESLSQFSSSMYLNLPSILRDPQVANFRPDTSPFSYIQPRIPQNQSERPNLMLGSSSHFGYFQPEEKARNYAQMSFRDMSLFNQNNTTSSSMGNGFTAPLHPAFNIPNPFDLENLTRENHNRLNLSLNGASGSGTIRLSGENYSLAESYNLSNNLQIPLNYRNDGRLVSYHDSIRFSK